MNKNIIVKIINAAETCAKIISIALTAFIACLHIHLVRNVIATGNGLIKIEYKESKNQNLYLIDIPENALFFATYNPNKPIKKSNGSPLKPGKIKIIGKINVYDYKGIKLLDEENCPSIFGTKGWSLLYQNRIGKKKTAIADFAYIAFLLTVLLTLVIKLVEYFARKVYFLDNRKLAQTANYLILDSTLFMLATCLVILIVY